MRHELYEPTDPRVTELLVEAGPLLLIDLRAFRHPGYTVLHEPDSTTVSKGSGSTGTSCQPSVVMRRSRPTGAPPSSRSAVSEFRGGCQPERPRHRWRRARVADRRDG